MATTNLIEAPKDKTKIPAEAKDAAGVAIDATVDKSQIGDQEAFNRFADKDDSSEIDITPLNRGEQPSVDQVDAGLDTISGLREAGQNRDAADQLTDLGNHVVAEDASRADQEPK